ncbi:acyl carrier protein [Paraburkholderia agricolaris]|uniref:Acyl carrier protein n=1 Tax=Paraburkholderia agricolaris TaxID=2152888 RepID=A0ABW8ZPC2_9BURK
MPEINTVFEFLKEMIVEIKDLDPADIQVPMTIDELALDSLDYVEMQVNIKRKFGVALSPMLFERRIKTLAQLCEYIVNAEPTREAVQ